MPVSVTISVDSKLVSPGWWGVLDSPLCLRIRTGGRSIEFTTSLRKLFGGGVTAFFEEPTRGLRPSPKRARRAATRQELATAEELGGQRQTGSGARRGVKGDGRVVGRYRIENKYTTAKSFALRLADLRKIRSECVGYEEPVFEVEFKDKATLRTIDRWALVPWDVWKDKVDEPRDDRGLGPGA